MPVMNGDVMMTKLREIPQLEGTPVLLLTAKADDQLRLRMLEEGGAHIVLLLLWLHSPYTKGAVADFMSKPFSVAELVARVQNLTQTSRVRRLLQRSLDIRYVALFISQACIHFAHTTHRETNLVRLTLELSERNAYAYLNLTCVLTRSSCSTLHAALTETKQARDEADRLNRMKDEFLMVVSHELRTPLHGILGWADIFGLVRRSKRFYRSSDLNFPRRS